MSGRHTCSVLVFKHVKREVLVSGEGASLATDPELLLYLKLYFSDGQTTSDIVYFEVGHCHFASKEDVLVELDS